MEGDVLPLFSSISASFNAFRGGRLLCSVIVLSPDEDLCNAICWVLELLGSKPHPCKCIEDALSLLKREGPDLVLCNLEVASDFLTSLRGDESCIGATGALKQAVVLLCEKRMDKRMLSACLNMGARSYITKPLRIQAIRGVIVGHCGAVAPDSRLEMDGESTPHEKSYEKIRELGRGRYGEVSLVQRRRDGARFALKEIMIDTLSAVEQRRVLEELKLHRAFDCPCVVRYYASWMQGDIAYLLMEFAENGSLSSLVSRCRDEKSEINDKNILDWGGQILVGLLYLHRKEVIHRDLKLDNVLGPDNLGRVKLADFGISKRLNGQEMLMSKIGTPEIMAPERCVDASKGEEAVGYGPESDLWSLGVVLYELATLKPPFSMEESASSDGVSGGDGVLPYDQRLKRLFVRIRTEEPPPLPFSRSGSLFKIVGSLLCKKPQDRPSASSLCKDPALGSAIHTFLKKHRLLDNPSILEIIDVLPSGKVHGGSRIESSDVDICTLQRFGSMTGGTFKSTLAASFGGDSFLDRSRLTNAELKNLPGVAEMADVIAEVNSANSTTVPTAHNTSHPVVSESPTCTDDSDQPFPERQKIELPLEALETRPGVSAESPRPPRSSSDMQEELVTDSNLAGSTGPSRPPRVPLPLPLGPMMQGNDSSVEGLSRKRVRDKPGPVGNFYTHPQRSSVSLRNGDMHRPDFERLAVSPGKLSSSRRGLDECHGEMSPQLDMIDPCKVSKKGGSRLEPLGDADTSRQRNDFQTPPRHPDPWNDPDRTGRSTGRSTGASFGSGDCTGRSSGRSSSAATGRRSLGQRSVSAALLPSLPNEETSPTSVVEQHPGLPRPASAASLLDFESIRADDLGSGGGSASSSSRARRQKLAPMPTMQGSRPLSVPRLSLPSKEPTGTSGIILGALEAPSPLRSFAALRDHTPVQTDSRRQHKEARARSGSLSRTSPGHTKRRTPSREKDLLQSQGTSALTRERLKASPSAPTLTLGLGPEELDLEGTGALNFDSCVQPVPAAPRSSNRCKSDAVLSRADAMLNRASSAPYLATKGWQSRNGTPDTEIRRSSRSASMVKVDSLSGDPSTAWAPLQSNGKPDVLA